MHRGQGEQARKPPQRSALPTPQQAICAVLELTPLDSRADTMSSRPCTAAAISGVAPLAAAGAFEHERGTLWRMQPPM